MVWNRRKLRPVELPQGFELRSFRPGQDEESLTELQNAAFQLHWGFAPNTVEEISARVPLGGSSPEGIILLTHGERVAAYNWTTKHFNDAGSVGVIGMTGLHPDYRHRRLGRSIVAAGIEYLNAKGVDQIELEVDSENLPAKYLYIGLGFRKTGRTWWYEKRLGA